MKEELEKELEGVDEEVQKASVLFDDEDISGNKIYGFQTPVKKNAMTQKALQSRTPRTPSSGKNLMSVRVLAEKIDQLSPTRKSKSSARVRFFSESESVSEDSEYVPSDDSADDDDIESEEDHDESDAENDAGNVTPKKNKAAAKKIQTPITPCRRGRPKNNIVYRDYVSCFYF